LRYCPAPLEMLEDVPVVMVALLVGGPETTQDEPSSSPRSKELPAARTERIRQFCVS
jgi:hypothetical protein